MIIFKSVRWKNLLSTGNYWIDIDLTKSSNTIIVGINGSGKSTMLDAMCFALFNKPFRNVPKKQLSNTINVRNCLAEIEFTTNGKSYKVKRGIKPSLFEIYCNNELLNQDAAIKDYQEHLERFILKLNYKSFTQIVVLGSASFTPFMQLKSADRKSIIENLLDIQIFSTMNNILKEKQSNNKTLTRDNKHDKDILDQKYKIKKSYIEEQKQNNEDKVKEYETEISTNIRIVEELTSNIANCNTAVTSLQEFVQKKIDVDNKIKTITKLESQIENNLTKYKKDKTFFEENDDCPTCRQSIEEHFKTGQISTLTNKISECSNGLHDIEKKIIEEQKKLNSIIEKQSEIQKYQLWIATNTSTITETNKYVKKLNSLIDDIKQKTNLSDDEEEELKAIKEEIGKLDTKLDELLDEKAYYDVASNLLKDSGVKTKIIKQYLPIINKLVNKYLAQLDFFVNFNLDENFEETIKSRFRDDFVYDSFSQGEKQRIDMALMLTWRAIAKLKNSSNTNLLVLDETFDSSLDSEGTEELMKILKDLEHCNLFVISHKGDILQDKFDNVIKFEKVKNFSKVVK